MPRDIAVKICGVTDGATVAAAVATGARYVGFVFFAPSPRNLGIGEAARLAGSVPAGVAKVALTVDATDEPSIVLTGLALDQEQG